MKTMDKKAKKNLPSCDEEYLLKGLGILLGLIVLTIGILSAAYELPNKYVEFKIKERVSISSESDTYQDWANPTIPIFMKFYLFNVTNKEEILKGGKPEVSELGPYIYRLYAPKFNVTFYENHTVSYYSNYSVVFQPDLSKGDETDEVFHLNFPLLVFENMARSTASISYFRILDGMVERAGGSDLFPKHTVREILFGYKDPISSMLKSWSMFFGPINPNFGFFLDFNHSSGGTYLINTGGNGRQAHKIDKWNNKKTLNFWSSEFANMVNGTAGTIFKTNLTPKNTPYFYFSQMCRSAKLEFEKKSRIKGLNALKFHISRDFLANSTINPENVGFCVPKENCYDSGILNVQTCKGSPIFLSYPHFYNSAEKYQNAVVGLTPTKGKHDSIFHVEPKSGAVLKCHRRVQINAPLRSTPQYRSLENVRETMFPILWFDLFAEISDVEDLKFALDMGKYIGIVSYFVIFIAFLILLLSTYFILKRYVRKKMQRYIRGTKRAGDASKTEDGCPEESITKN